MTTTWPLHGRIGGPIVMIGFGSIGKGTLPLIERHFEFDKSRFVVIDPSDKDRHLLDERGIRFVKAALTRDNYREILAPLLTAGGGQGFCVNLSVDTSSVDIMELARENGALYIDTVNEPWAGFYFDASKGPGARTNYVLREETLAARARNPGGPTAVSCCGANPGMVSWFVKQALLDLARDLAIEAGEPATQQDWARLMQRVGVKGIHIAERDTQRATSEKPMQVFVNTWSVEGFVSEGMQPAELGWGTHERWLPEQRRPAGQATASRSTSTSPAPTRACGAGARRPARNTASSSRTTNRSRSRTSSRCARATGWRTARPATTPTTRATRRCCRCTRCSARGAGCRSATTS